MKAKGSKRVGKKQLIKKVTKTKKKSQFQLKNNSSLMAEVSLGKQISSGEDNINQSDCETDHSQVSLDRENKSNLEETTNSFLNDESGDSNLEDSFENDINEGLEHKKSLLKLKDTDPEFYKYLQENDQNLLQFDDSDTESERSEDDLHHKPPDKLEVDSEESDLEGDLEFTRGSLSLSVIDSWRESLLQNPNLKNISLAVKGFHAALERVTGEDTSEFKVEGSAVFNAIVELCVMHLLPSVTSFLKLTPGNLKHPEKLKKWSKVKSVLQSYFADLLKLTTGVASEHIVSVLLKHLHQACHLLACYKKLSKLVLKHLTKLWSSGEETIRVLAFLCVLRICTSQKSDLLNSALKYLYISYIQSSKFVSVNTLPQINFMRRSLSCLFSLNQTLSYQHAFLYIRQLAIHLRNAVTVHKKENFQSVYNWQYINSLKLWVDVLSNMKDSVIMKQLLYPLVQVIIGCIKLIPTAQYSPLRFHCVKMLSMLGHEMDTHIPIIPFVIEALSWVRPNSNHKKLSMKPFDFTCVLRLSKAAMVENGFQDAVIENIYNSLLEVTAHNSHLITYPDLVVPAISQLKVFMKECQVPKYTSKLKQLLLKLEENSKFINEERNKICIQIADFEKIKAFESKMLAQKPPLLKFWEQWSKVFNIMAAKKVTNNTELGKFNLPTLNKKTGKGRVIVSTKGKTPELFPSDEEDEIDLKIEETPVDQTKRKRKVKNKVSKKVKLPSVTEIKVHMPENDDKGEDDIVEDLNPDEFN